MRHPLRLLACAAWLVLLSAVALAATIPPASDDVDVRLQPPAGTNTVFTPTRYTDLEQWQARRDWLRDQVRLAAGLIPEIKREPIAAQIFGKLERDGYTVEKAFFPSAAGMYVTGNLYRPSSPGGKHPAVACPHGHWANGRLHHDERGSVPARCITLARNGAVVFAYDMIGYNDASRTFQHRDARFETPETALWNIGHLQLQTLNSIRVIDFLQSLPDVDPGRIGVTGASGGGTQTFILDAVDDRVTIDCPVNMISSTMQGGCVCENAPLLRIDTNNMEIAALFAPRPRLLVSATGDWTTLTPTVEFPFVQSIYDLYGAAQRISNVHVDAQHNYNLQSRQAMYAFFGERLLGLADPKRIQESPIPVEKPEDLLVFDDAHSPADLAGPDRIIELAKQQIVSGMAAYRPQTASKLGELTRLVRLWLEHAAGTRWPEPGEIQGLSRWCEDDTLRHVEARRNRQGRMVLEQGVAARASANRPTGLTVLCVHPAGRSGADEQKDLVDALVKAGCRVIFIEPFGTGENRREPRSTQPAADAGFFTTFNRTEAAEGVYDIITSLASAADPTLSASASGSPAHIRLVGFGRMGPVCLLARALVPERFVRRYDLRTLVDMNGFDTHGDAAYVEALFVPGIQRFGGLPAVAAVAANSPLWLHRTNGKFDTTLLDQARTVTKAPIQVDPAAAEIEPIVSWITNPN